MFKSKILNSQNKTQQNSNNQQKSDRRFYYIRVKDIKNISPQLIQYKTPLKLLFQISTKKSQTTFKTDYQTSTKIDDKQRQRLRQQAHFFSFEAEEILSVKLFQQAPVKNIKTVKENVKKQKNQQTIQQKKQTIQHQKMIGYSNILLTPFMTLPHTCHSIKVNMVFQQQDKNVIKQLSAILQLDIYFFLDFKAKLQIFPLKAHINHNTSSFGLMNPCIIMTLNGQRKKSITVDQGGINPNWEKYAQKIKKNYILGGTQAEELKDNEQLNNCYTFSLDSVGHEFKIQIISYPLFGQDVYLVGSTTLRLQSLGYFKNPNTFVQFSQIKFRYIDPETKSIAQGGELSLKTRFTYDIINKRRQINSDSQSQNQDQD